MNRVRKGETLTLNNKRVNADAIIVATRPQFTAIGAKEKLPVQMETVSFGALTWRAEYVMEDETHITLYLAKNP